MTYKIQPNQRKEGNHESFTGRSRVPGVPQIEFQFHSKGMGEYFCKWAKEGLVDK
jgi:hypothetical protein